MNKGRHSILGVGIDAVDYDEVVAEVLANARAHRWFGVAALPVHGVMSAVLDPGFAKTLAATSLNVPDGQPVRWALGWLHHVTLVDRVYGPNLMLRVCAQAAAERFPIYLFGSTPEVLTRLRAKLVERFPALIIAGTGSGPQGEDAATPRSEDLVAIQASGARVVFVALGCPKQEKWMVGTRGRLDMPILAVGAAFDFHAGMVSQAPPVLQQLGLEWAFRLAMEPKRLWQRYLFLNPAYLALIGLQRVGLFKAR
jgi:N-acetylglucosaminyldiphosphoundecaprenol N-acetyl-beta-D-mannosaminyltransferase